MKNNMLGRSISKLQTVMLDKNITPEAKAIYGFYFSLEANEVKIAVTEAAKDLNMSVKRFRKHREQLIERGYITIGEAVNKGQGFLIKKVVVNGAWAGAYIHDN